MSMHNQVRERDLLFSEWVLTSDGLDIADASLLWFNITNSSGFFSPLSFSVCVLKK